ncbi:hypothetical protein M231_04052 [Tremella mesenterica]|uniref:Uncharacterized protein n=1 Tax=Tremella mesenterica TaxID=5217 RepID=A0A4Q1BLH8_TREME|nr:hypothetical protein M231_04052 [Tremella mesenterica]
MSNTGTSTRTTTASDDIAVNSLNPYTLLRLVFETVDRLERYPPQGEQVVKGQGDDGVRSEPSLMRRRTVHVGGCDEQARIASFSSQADWYRLVPRLQGLSIGFQTTTKTSAVDVLILQPDEPLHNQWKSSQSRQPNRDATSILSLELSPQIHDLLQRYVHHVGLTGRATVGMIVVGEDVDKSKSSSQTDQHLDAFTDGPVCEVSSLLDDGEESGPNVGVEYLSENEHGSFFTGISGLKSSTRIASRTRIKSKTMVTPDAGNKDDKSSDWVPPRAPTPWPIASPSITMTVSDEEQRGLADEDRIGMMGQTISSRDIRTPSPKPRRHVNVRVGKGMRIG